MRIGKYALHEKVGEGGMGEVWKAWDEPLHRWVALKLLKNADAEDRARFEREARAAAGISHPNIAGVFEAGEVDGRPFIAMQFVDGDRLDRSRRDLHQSVAWVRDAALAVHAAHGAGVIHRDLKPANILVERETGRVYVTDFGLAKQVSVDASISASGTIVGTAGYMPPEQILGGTADARSDVYSPGATLYELIAGRPPFDGASAMDRFMKALSEEPPPLRTASDLQTIVSKCLEKDAPRRYATAKELADDLEQFLHGANGYLETAAACHLTGQCRYVEERLPDAWAAWERALEIDATFGEARFALAKSLLIQAARARSIPPVDPSEDGLVYTELPPARPEVGQYRDRARRILGSGTSFDEADQSLLEGLFSFTDGDYAAAAPRILPYARRERGDLWVQIILGNAQLAVKDFPGAEKTFQDTLRFGANYQFYYGRGMARHGRGDFRGAIEDYTAAMPLNPELADLYLARAGAFWGEIRLRRNDFPGAIGDFKEALKFRESSRCHGLLGQAYRLSGDLDLARPHLDRALELDPKRIASWLDRASIRYLKKDYAGALEDFNRGIALGPNEPIAYANRGLVHEALGDKDRAKADYEKALDLAPKDWEPRAAVERRLRSMD